METTTPYNGKCTRKRRGRAGLPGSGAAARIRSQVWRARPAAAQTPQRQRRRHNRCHVMRALHAQGLCSCSSCASTCRQVPLAAARVLLAWARGAAVALVTRQHKAYNGMEFDVCMARWSGVVAHFGQAPAVCCACSGTWRCATWPRVSGEEIQSPPATASCGSTT